MIERGRERGKKDLLKFVFCLDGDTVKLPFPLTLGFKSMLQRGIETPDMDVRWVSSLSWYFLNFFGLNGLYRIILGGDNCTHPLPPLTFSPPPLLSSHSPGFFFSGGREQRHGRDAVQPYDGEPRRPAGFQ